MTTPNMLNIYSDDGQLLFPSESERRMGSISPPTGESRIKLELKDETCELCLGTGDYEQQPCVCVTDEIFRRCYGHFRTCIPGCASGSRVHTDIEYSADFINIVRNTLTPTNHTLFRYRYYLGCDNYALLARRLNVSAFRIKTALTDIERQVALAFIRTKPYGIFPVQSY